MWKPDEEEFFIGYAPPMPPRLGRFVRRVVIGIGCFVVIVAVTLASGHLRLEGGTFEFGHPKSFSGTIVERPYPGLGSMASTRTSSRGRSSWLLENTARTLSCAGWRDVISRSRALVSKEARTQ